MERDVFRALVRRLRGNGLVDSRYVSVEEQLAIFLYAVSKNASNRVLQDQFQHSGETISRHFAAVLNALTQLTCHYICLPSPHPHRILRQPKFSPYFQNRIGAIDGTHIPMTISVEKQEPYRNRKARVVIDNDACDNATVIRVDRVKKHGILLEAVQVLVDLNLVITKAYISSDGNWFMDVFNVTDQDGSKLQNMEVIDHIQKTPYPCGLQQCLESDGYLAPPANGPMGGFALPAEDQFTSIELTGADRPGLLSEVCAVLAALSCNIVKAEVWTHDRRAAAVILITDEATRLAIHDAGRLSRARTGRCTVIAIACRVPSSRSNNSSSPPLLAQ
ncbi:unnamed protein product [Miscanthus lutarioriparius]|uniref:ACT domain-containing protein ACR n=1 Tax=Miscanthus lutarioriparius TaxID=422564 RepID=A0A811R457_9POAL|nr:unnamed protein product [Miscanthus lutarioriparius]